MEGAAINRTDSVLRGCGVLKDGAPQDCPEPASLLSVHGSSSQDRDRGEEKVG